MIATRERGKRMAAGRRLQDTADPGAQAPGRRPGAVKVPEVTAYFWVVKLLTTAMGEAVSDYLG
jgi:hypothetical protein